MGDQGLISSVGNLSQYVTSHACQLSLAILCGLAENQPTGGDAGQLGVKAGMAHVWYVSCCEMCHT